MLFQSRESNTQDRHFDSEIICFGCPVLLARYFFPGPGKQDINVVWVNVCFFCHITGKRKTQQKPADSWFICIIEKC